MKILSYAQLCSASFYIKPTGSCLLLLQSDCFQMHADCICILTELDTLECAHLKQLNCAFGWCNSLRGRWTGFWLFLCLLLNVGQFCSVRDPAHLECKAGSVQDVCTISHAQIGRISFRNMSTFKVDCIYY